MYVYVCSLNICYIAHKRPYVLPYHLVCQLAKFQVAVHLNFEDILQVKLLSTLHEHED
jgi:hypothetical protein